MASVKSDKIVVAERGAYGVNDAFFVVARGRAAWKLKDWLLSCFEVER